MRGLYLKKPYLILLHSLAAEFALCLLDVLWIGVFYRVKTFLLHYVKNLFLLAVYIAQCGHIVTAQLLTVCFQNVSIERFSNMLGFSKYHFQYILVGKLHALPGRLGRLTGLS